MCWYCEPDEHVADALELRRIETNGVVTLWKGAPMFVAQHCPLCRLGIKTDTYSSSDPDDLKGHILLCAHAYIRDAPRWAKDSLKARRIVSALKEA